MKVKNVVFSGFMAAVLMSATGTASAAGVSVASQGYVDAKVSTATSAATSAVSALADTVAANKTAAENATKAVADDLADYETANNTAVSGLDTRLTAAEGTIGEHTTAIAGINEELDKMATSETVTGLTGDVSALKTQVGEGNVADRIAAAVATETSARQTADATLQGKIDAITNETTGVLAQAKADATTKADAAEAAAKLYADGLAGNYDAKGSADDALTAAKAYTDELANGQVKTNKESIASINTKLGTMATSETVTALTERVGTAESDIDALQAKDTELAGAIATNAQGVADNKSAIDRIEEAYIAKPAACANTYCVLSVNGETISWMPLTEPVENFMGE